MPLDTSLQASQVTVGKLDEIAPDLPVGAWTGSVVVKNRVNDAGYHQLILEWTAEESQTDSDEGVGGATAEFITFSPGALKMAKVRIKEMCEAYQIDVPDGTCLEEGTVEGLESFVEALESEKRPFWTTHQKRKDTGEVRVQVRCTAPGQKLERATEEEEEEHPKANGKTPPSPTSKLKKKIKR
jgi:hypothetical protein